MKLKINLYKSALIVIAIAIVALFYAGVWDYYNEISALKAKLAQKEKDIDKLAKNPDTKSTRAVVRIKEYQSALDTETNSCKGYYKTKGELLSRWFPGMAVKPDGIPEAGDFKAKYVDEKNGLIRALKERKIKIGAITKGDEEPISEDIQLGFSEPTADNIKMVQKQFWLQQMLVNAMIESDVVHCEKISFTIKNPAPGGGAKSGTSPNNPFAGMRKIPGDIGTAIPFELHIRLANKNAPAFVYNILRNAKDSFLMDIRKIELVRVMDEITAYPEIKTPDKQPLGTEKESYKPPALAIPLIKLVIEGEALDFDIK